MTDIPIEELNQKISSIYKLVNVASRRAAELASGLLPLVETDSKKPTTIALQEIQAGRVTFNLKEK